MIKRCKNLRFTEETIDAWIYNLPINTVDYIINFNNMIFETCFPFYSLLYGFHEKILKDLFRVRSINYD